jgi:hypothetical protein
MLFPSSSSKPKIMLVGLGCIHRANMSIVDDVSEVHAVSIFRPEV